MVTCPVVWAVLEAVNEIIVSLPFNQFGGEANVVHLLGVRQLTNDWSVGKIQ